MTTRTLRQVIRSVPTSDGAGVKLRRSLGSGVGLRHDPFLMLDEFSSENPGDYIAGFPAHPHRGFETVTYLLDGHMLHEDHLGHRGDLKSGAVQWMTAGRGIIHSEMPQQLEGRMRGFQLWINLPAKEKMKPASYRDIDPSEIPTVQAGRRDRESDRGQGARRRGRVRGADQRPHDGPAVLRRRTAAGRYVRAAGARELQRVRICVRRRRSRRPIGRGTAARDAERRSAFCGRRDSRESGCEGCALPAARGQTASASRSCNTVHSS